MTLSDLKKHIQHYRWVRWIIAVWALRLASSFLAVGVPMVVELYYEFSSRSTQFLAPTIKSVPWDDELNALLDAEDERVLKVIRGAPVPRIDELMSSLSRLSPDIAHVKTKDSPHFVYYATDRSWCKKHKLPGASHDTISMSVAKVADVILSEDDAKGSTDQSLFYYMSYEFQRPKNDPFIQQSVPYLLQLGGHGGVGPQMRLWMNSRNTSATFHYDMENNFFVQLSGSKTFTLAHADAYLFLSPGPSLDPSWRQSRWTGLRSARDLMDAAVKYLEASTLSDSVCSSPDMLLQNHHRLNPICTYQQLIWGKEGEFNKTQIAAELFGISEVELSPGDVLHIPPFYFHAVTAGRSSISVNAWLGSREFVVSTKLKNVPLPFAADAATSEKLQAVRFLIMRLFFLFGHNGVGGLEYRLFSESLLLRHSGLDHGGFLYQCEGAAIPDHSKQYQDIKDNHDVDPANSKKEVGGSGLTWPDGDLHGSSPVSADAGLDGPVILHQQAAPRPSFEELYYSYCRWNYSRSELMSIERGWNVEIQKSSALIYTQLEKLTNQISIRNLLLMDYVEDVLDLIFEEKSSPCVVGAYIRGCIALPRAGAQLSGNGQ